MFNLREDIQPVTDFKRDTAGFVKHIKRTRRPVVLTVNGRAELVVQDAASYQQMVHRLEVVEAIGRGLKDVEEGRVYDAKGALKRLKGKLGIPR